MSKVAEIVQAISLLLPEEKYAIYCLLKEHLPQVIKQSASDSAHSVLDIAPVHLGALLKPFRTTDNAPTECLLGEMLAERE